MARRSRKYADNSISNRTDKINESFRDIQTEGQGIFEVTFVSPEEALNLLLGAMEGKLDAQQSNWLRAIMSTINQLDTPHIKLYCLLCNTAFSRQRKPTLLGILGAYNVDSPSSMLVNGICASCVAKPDLQGRVFGKIREWIPDATAISVSPMGCA